MVARGELPWRFRWPSAVLLVCAFSAQVSASGNVRHGSAALQKHQHRRKQEENAALPVTWTWSRVDASGIRPSGRQGHSAVELGQRVYVFGGCQQEIRCYNDLHIFDAESLSWLQEPATGEPPEARGGHSAVLVGSNIFIYGGANSEETFSDVHMFDPIKRHWSRVAASSPTGSSGPGRRTGHAAATDSRGHIFLFGGYDADGNFLNDVWILSLYVTGADSEFQETGQVPGAWSQPVVTGPVPAAREGHTLTHVDGRLLTFGGYTSSGATANDVHAYDPETQTWTLIEVSAPQPKPRQAHSAARHGHDLVIAGGCEVSAESPECYSDVWTLSLIDMRWTQRSTDVVSWFAREGHSASFVRGRMLVFGGCELGARCFDDIAALDTADPCPSECGHHGRCAEGLFCQCTATGFTGHDCMQPLICFADCGEHGVCSQDGTCSCENGWAGEGCDQELPCPGDPKCSGNGLCLASGGCKCNAGFAGADCSAVALAFTAVTSKGMRHRAENATAAEFLQSDYSWGKTVEPPASENLTSGLGADEGHITLIDPFATAHHAAERASSKGRPPTNRDFGIQTIYDAGIEESGPQCVDNCNFRGLCGQGICYCQPGYYGEHCETMKDSGEGSQSLVTVIAISVVCFVCSLGATLVLLKWNASSKRQREEAHGYNI